MVRLLSVVGILAALAVSSAVALPRSELPLDAVVIDELGAALGRSEEASSRAKAVELLLAKEGALSALAALEEIDEPLAFESAADALVRRLQVGDDSPDVRSSLEALSSTPIRVFKRHDETRADWFVPVFDVAASARYALRSLSERRQRLHWGEQLTSDPRMALATLTEADDGALTRAAEAIASLNAADLDQLSKLMLIQPEHVDSALWRALALRSQTVLGFDAAARYCNDQDLLGLLDAAMALPGGDATDWLLTLSARPQLTSAALLAMAPLAEKDSRALAALIAVLDSAEMGSTAAAALAKRPHSDRLNLIEDLMEDADASPRRLQSLALALRLEGSPGALDLLRVLGQDQRLSPALRAELNR